MQMEMEKGGMMYVFPFFLVASLPVIKRYDMLNKLISTGSSTSSLPFATTWYVLFAPAPPPGIRQHPTF